MERSLSWSLLGHYSSNYNLATFFFSEKNCKGVLPHDKLINSTLQHTKNLNHRGPGLPRGGGDVGGMLKLGIDQLINRKEVWSLID